MIVTVSGSIGGSPPCVRNSLVSDPAGGIRAGPLDLHPSCSIRAGAPAGDLGSCGHDKTGLIVAEVEESGGDDVDAEIPTSEPRPGNASRLTTSNSRPTR